MKKKVDNGSAFIEDVTLLFLRNILLQIRSPHKW